MPDPDRPDPDPPDTVDLARFARAAARQSGLVIDEAWWPSVVGYLAMFLDRAASLEGADIDLPDDPAPVFQP